MHFILYGKTLSGTYQLLPQIHAVNIRCQALVTPTYKRFRRGHFFISFFIKSANSLYWKQCGVFMQMLNLKELMDSESIIEQRAILLFGFRNSISKSNTLLQKVTKPQPTEPALSCHSPYLSLSLRRYNEGNVIKSPHPTF
jgi:hypothetical protein